MGWSVVNGKRLSDQERKTGTEGRVRRHTAGGMGDRAVRTNRARISHVGRILFLAVEVGSGAVDIGVVEMVVHLSERERREGK